MSEKKTLWLGVFVGSLIGGFLPVMLGANFLSENSTLWGFIGSIAGGIAGLFVAYQIVAHRQLY